MNYLKREKLVFLLQPNSFHNLCDFHDEILLKKFFIILFEHPLLFYGKTHVWKKNSWDVSNERWMVEIEKYGKVFVGWRWKREKRRKVFISKFFACIRGKC